jgi:hypothetical protein
MKQTLIAAPALALACAQKEFYENGAKDFIVTPQATKPNLRILKHHT